MSHQDPHSAEARRARFDEAMAAGAREYQDVLDRLAEEGLGGVFTQTGGMNAALEITLDGGSVLITDAEDTLSWSRADHEGWFVGLYLRRDESDGPIRYLTTEDGSVDGLMTVLKELLLENRSS
jgi:hypothetical protein